MSKTHVILILYFVSFFCVWKVVCLSTGFSRELSQVSSEFKAKKVTEEVRKERTAAAYIKFIGDNYAWHLGATLSFTFGSALGFGKFPSWWSRGFFTLLTIVVFALATSVFVSGDVCVDFVEKPLRAEILGAIVQMKSASAFVALLAGGLVFEMLKPLWAPKDNA